MLKGHVFKEQVFESEVFAYFVDTFLYTVKTSIRDKLSFKYDTISELCDKHF